MSTVILVHQYLITYNPVRKAHISFLSCYDDYPKYVLIPELVPSAFTVKNKYQSTFTETTITLIHLIHSKHGVYMLTHQARVQPFRSLLLLLRAVRIMCEEEE